MLPRFADFFKIGRDEILARQSKLQAAVVDKRGTDANAIVAVPATMAEEVARQVGIALQDRLLSTARGEALDRIVWDWFGLLRNDAACARVVLTFSRTGSASGTVAAGTKAQTAAGIEFWTLDDLIFPSYLLTADVEAICSMAGEQGNVVAGAINILPVALFDSTFTVTNAAVAAGGSAREDDDAFRARARRYWLSARRGTLAAVEFGALDVDGVGMAEATETALTDLAGNTVGLAVQLAVADSEGNANQALADAVLAVLDEWRPCGVYVSPVAATIQWLDVDVEFAVMAGQDSVSAVNRVRAAVVAFVNSLRIGEKLMLNAIYEAVRSDFAVAKNSVQVAAPAADVVPTATEVIRTSADRVKVNQ
jgi:uncharacterized phage protein gp47/JayE